MTIDYRNPFVIQEMYILNYFVTRTLKVIIGSKKRS